MSIIKTMGFCSVALLLAACNGRDKENSVSEFDGVWIAPAYGQVMTYDGTTLNKFDYTSEYCVLAEASEITSEAIKNEGWFVSDSGKELFSHSNDFGVSVWDPTFTRIESVPNQCQAGYLLKTTRDDTYEVNTELMFDLFWQTFNEYYLSFNLKGVDWEAQYSKYRDEITPNMTEADFVDVVSAMVEPLRDAHVFVNDTSFSNYPWTLDIFEDEFIDAHGEIDSDEKYAQFTAYVEAQVNLVFKARRSAARDESAIKTGANGQLEWFDTPYNVGVLIIDGMAGFVDGDDENEDNFDAYEELLALDEALTEALTDLQNTQALIIDLRANSGGFDAASQLIATHFLDVERHLYSKQARLKDGRTALQEYRLTPSDENNYLNPVVLLTSRNTTSAAEVFTLMMRNLPQVTLIGEPTQGAFSDVLAKQLPNGVQLGLSNEYYLSPEGEWFEDEGIPVKNYVEFATKEQRAEGRDDGISEAIHLLVGDPAPPMEK